MKHRPDLAPWLDRALRQAYAAAPAERYGDVLELLFELEHAQERAPPSAGSWQPLYHRDPVRFLQILSALLAIALLAAIGFLLGRR